MAFAASAAAFQHVVQPTTQARYRKYLRTPFRLWGNWLDGQLKDDFAHFTTEDIPKICRQPEKHAKRNRSTSTTSTI